MISSMGVVPASVQLSSSFRTISDSTTFASDQDLFNPEPIVNAALDLIRTGDAEIANNIKNIADALKDGFQAIDILTIGIALIQIVNEFKTLLNRTNSQFSTNLTPNQKKTVFTSLIPQAIPIITQKYNIPMSAQTLNDIQLFLPESVECILMLLNSSLVKTIKDGTIVTTNKIKDFFLKKFSCCSESSASLTNIPSKNNIAIPDTTQIVNMALEQMQTGSSQIIVNIKNIATALKDGFQATDILPVTIEVLRLTREFQRIITTINKQLSSINNLSKEQEKQILQILIPESIPIIVQKSNIQMDDETLKRIQSLSPQIEWAIMLLHHDLIRAIMGDKTMTGGRGDSSHVNAFKSCFGMKA